MFGVAAAPKKKRKAETTPTAAKKKLRKQKGSGAKKAEKSKKGSGAGASVGKQVGYASFPKMLRAAVDENGPRSKSNKTKAKFWDFTRARTDEYNEEVNNQIFVWCKNRAAVQKQAAKAAVAGTCKDVSLSDELLRKRIQAKYVRACFVRLSDLVLFRFNNDRRDWRKKTDNAVLKKEVAEGVQDAELKLAAAQKKAAENAANGRRAQRRRRKVAKRRDGRSAAMLVEAVNGRPIVR